MKIIDRSDPVNLIGGIYTKNNLVNGNEMIVEVVEILEHRVFNKDTTVNYFILDILTTKTGHYLNPLYSYTSGPYHRNKLLYFTGSINNKYTFEFCNRFLNEYTKKT